MRFSSEKILLFTIVLFAVATSADLLQAQDGKRGRLPDGQAFRTDADGTEIIDYIAELELNSLELNRTIDGLKDENQQLRMEIERLKAGREEFVVEKDLLNSTDRNFLSANSLSSKSAEVGIAISDREEVESEETQEDQNQPPDPAFSEEEKPVLNTGAEGVRQQLIEEIHMLMARKDERDLLYQKNNPAKLPYSNFSINVKPSLLISRSGKDLNQLEKSIREVQNPRELALLRAEVAEVGRQLEDDFKYMEKGQGGGH